MSVATASTDPFAPVAINQADVGPGDGDRPKPILPVPAGAPPADFHHHRLGEPSATWCYRDAAGRLLGYAARFEPASGKEILPRTWCQRSDGTQGWSWKAFPSPRPLYGLERLEQLPQAPVLLVEGEKTADAGIELFPGCAVVTWPGGANAVGRADFFPLRGRDVVLWPDADVDGDKAMRAAAGCLFSAKARSIRLVELPKSLPRGWDLADAAPAGIDVGDLLARAQPISPGAQMPPGYFMRSDGLYWRDTADDAKSPIHLAGPFDVVAETRDLDGTSWGVLLHWRDHDGRPHRVPIPRAMLAGDGADARRMLLDGGLFVTPGRTGRERLTAFLAMVRAPGRVRATNRIGWHQSTFVLPDACFGADNEDLILQGTGAIENAFRERGTIEEWQQQVARLAVGNSRLVLAISAAFAAPLVFVTEGESGGIHFRGASSTGKSTALMVAGSVWGGGEPGGYVRSWRATANGLEGVGLGHCDTLLCLDELAQVSARDAGEAAYMLANGSGKSRGARDGSARRIARWRLLFLSSGEISLSDKVIEDGRRRAATAGQQVRIIDLPADAGCRFGLFEELHEFDSAEALARHLRQAATSVYGTAARPFIERLAADRAGVRAAVENMTASFIADHVPSGADGQVLRVALRFALVAAGGEIAVASGVLPWPPGVAIAAAARCLADWIIARGGVQPAEIADGIEQIRSFLHAHGMSRFAPAWEQESEPRLPVRDLAGYRRREGDGWDYYVTGPAWREMGSGYSTTLLARILAERGLLFAPNTGRHLSKPVAVPGHGKPRLYHLSGRILEGGDD